MNVDQINAELQDIAQTALDLEHESRYNDMLDEMFAYHDMMMYATYSYDADAVSYGY